MFVGTYKTKCIDKLGVISRSTLHHYILNLYHAKFVFFFIKVARNLFFV